MRTLSYLIIALLSSGITACGDGRSSDAGTPDAEVESLPSRDEFVQDGLRPEFASPSALESSLGKPDSVRSQPVANRHVPDVTDTLSAIHYPGLTLETHRPGGGEDIVAAVDVRENRYLAYSLIGRTRQEVEAEFGPPGEIRDGRYVYLCGSCPGVENPVELIFERDQVRRVRFTYYVD